MSYILYTMKSLKMIMKSRWGPLPLVIRRSTQGMRCNKIIGQGSEYIKEEVLDDFFHA